MNLTHTENAQTTGNLRDGVKDAHTFALRWVSGMKISSANVSGKKGNAELEPRLGIKAGEARGRAIGRLETER